MIVFWGCWNRRIDDRIDWGQYENIGVLGIDEIALKKGHGRFCGDCHGSFECPAISDFGVLENREKDTVIAFLRSIPIRLLKTIHTVCSDMYEGFHRSRSEKKSSRPNW